MKRKTLYDPKAVTPDIYYSYEIRHFFVNDNCSFCGEEVSVFDDVLEGERLLSIDTLGALAGDVVVQTNSKRPINLGQKDTIFNLPIWPEPEALQFSKCSAKRVILVEKWTAFNRIVNSGAHRDLDALLIAANGMPRFSTRRVAHRLCTQFNLPLYILADNDTWGYFMFSLMKRGVVDPAKAFPYAAVKDTRYLGMRCKDVEQFDDAKAVMHSHQSYWKYRIAALRKYACFKSKAWQQEFDTFEKQKGKFELDALVGRKGIDYVINKYLKPKLEENDYLK